MKLVLPIIQHAHTNCVEGEFEMLTRDLDQVVEVIPPGDRFAQFTFEDLPWLRELTAIPTRRPVLHDSVWGDRLQEGYLMGKRLIIFGCYDVPGGTSTIRYRVA